MERRTRRTILKTAKFAVTTSLLGWILHAIVTHDGMGDLGARLLNLRWEWVGLAVALQLFAVLAGVKRWHRLLGTQGLHLDPRFLLETYLVGRFVGAFTPSTAGLDVYRVVAISNKTGFRGKATGTMLLEKFLGLISLSILTFALLPAGASRFFGPPAMALAAILGLGAIAGLAWLRFPVFPRPLTNRLPRGVVGKLNRLSFALRARPIPRAGLVEAVALGTASHFFTACVFVATGHALGVEASFVDLMIVGNAIVIATLLPLSIGGVGVREGTAVVLLGLVGVSAGDAALVGLLGYLTAQPPALLGGIQSLTRSRSEATLAPA